MERKSKDWSTTIQSIGSTSLTGDRMALKVPVYTHNKRKTQMVFLKDLVMAEQKAITNNFGLTTTQIHEILLIYADSRFFEGKRIIEKTYRFNKMLFYLWKRMDDTEYASAYEHDEFGAARAGPVPKNLKKSLKNLEEKGFVKVQWHHKPGMSSRFELTEKGIQVATTLWKSVPDNIKFIYKQVKQELALLGAEEIKQKVHKEFPEYKKNYTELDNEE